MSSEAKKLELLKRTRIKIAESYAKDTNKDNCMGLELTLLLTKVEEVINEDYSKVRKEIARHERVYHGNLSCLKELI